jgi:PKD domain
MKITKTTLLFIATLFFLALPLMFVSSNAQAANFISKTATYSGYNYDGAVHDPSTHGWALPSDTGHCYGVSSTDVSGTAAHEIIPRITDYDACIAAAPAWLAATYTDATSCQNKGFYWHPYGTPSCQNNWAFDTQTAENNYANHECLYCHSGPVDHAHDKSGYLMGGHKNMTRKADGIPWTTSIEFGSVDLPGYDWTTAGSANGVTSPSTLSDGTTPVFWIYDGWLSATPRAVTSGSSYSCGRCHTTGWTADATLQASKEPEASFPGINNIVNLSAADDSGTPQPYSSWDHFGILCSRCHNAVNGKHANQGGPAADNMDTALPAGGPSQAAKCYNCHRQVDSNNLPLNAQTLLIGEQLTIKAGHGGALGITSHANGYLNSPHARFSGTYGQLADSTQYDSHFITGEGTCAACHNVHDSLTDTNVGAKPWNKECGLDCHSQSPTDPYGKPLSAINHPTGPGTPFQPGGYGTVTATVTNPVVACETCHMPGGIHLFRINPDPSYSTYAAGAGGYVSTVPDASHNNFPSAYVDLDMACGQCHGGGDASTVTTAKATAQAHGAPYFTKTELAPYAEVMHGGSGSSAPTGKLFSWTNDSSNSYVVNFTVGGAACTEGGCTYTWNFGDGSATVKGPAVSHDYTNTIANAPFSVTLTVSNGGTNTQIVTPTAVHTAPTCSGFTPVVTGMGLSISGGVTGTSDTAPGVYVNWGDGSPLSTGGTGDTFTHTYIWPNSHVGYKVTEIVQDNEGFNCVNTAYVKIGNGGAVATTGDVTINVTSGVKTSYYFKQGGLTKVSGSFTDAQVAAGSAAVTVPTGTYDLYLYFATGHTCDYTQGSSATTGGPAVDVTCTTP